MASITNLERMSAVKLSEIILAKETSSADKLAIIDVRDDDHIGGHIKGSMHVPSGNLDAMLPTLVRKLEDKDVVVFHCALSQQRGPGAALRYIRAKKEKEQAKPSASVEGQKDGPPTQKVYVLDRGFVGWQEVYGENERLTEAYVKDLWKDGYN